MVCTDWNLLARDIHRAYRCTKIILSTCVAASTVAPKFVDILWFWKLVVFQIVSGQTKLAAFALTHTKLLCQEPADILGSNTVTICRRVTQKNADSASDAVQKNKMYE